MPHDGGQDVIVAFERPATSALRKIASGLDYSKALVWDTVDCMGEFHALIERPPLHSVVVRIGPPMAKALLEVANGGNRPLNKGTLALLAGEMTAGGFELTGDTLKWGKSGRLLDGQHRLGSVVASKKTLTTHAVFGLNDEVFDILDRQRTRTPGDILAMCGVKDYILVAGAVRWVAQLQEGRKGITSRGMSPRRIRELATGPMKGLASWTQQANLINKAYKAPPTMVAALLFLIGKHSAAVAEAFAKDWLHGNRNFARNKNFDVLSQRIITVRAQSGGTLNRSVLAAMLVQTFNYWNANITATPRALTWKKGWGFPQLAFDKAAFAAGLDRSYKSDTSLKAQQLRLLQVLRDAQDKDGNSQVSYRDLAEKTGVPIRQIGYALTTLRDAGALHLSKKPDGKTLAPAIWRIKAKGEETLAEKAE